MIIGNLYDFNFLLFDCFQLIVNGQTGEIIHHVPKVVVVGEKRDKGISWFKNPMVVHVKDQMMIPWVVTPKIVPEFLVRF